MVLSLEPFFIFQLVPVPDGPEKVALFDPTVDMGDQVLIKTCTNMFSWVLLPNNTIKHI